MTRPTRPPCGVPRLSNEFWGASWARGPHCYSPRGLWNRRARALLCGGLCMQTPGVSRCQPRARQGAGPEQRRSLRGGARGLWRSVLLGRFQGPPTPHHLHFRLITPPPPSHPTSPQTGLSALAFPGVGSQSLLFPQPNRSLLTLGNLHLVLPQPRH